MKTALWTVGVTALVIACGSGSGPAPKSGRREVPAAVRLAPPSAQQAVRLALDTLEARALLKDQDFSLTARRSAGQWVIWLVYLPEYFGGDVVVFVKDDRTTEVMLGF